MRVLDLFSGIGGFSLGLERAGMETVAFCEIEDYPCKVLAKHWPDVPVYNDVRELTYDRLKQDGITNIDVLCGGFPCQDISTAGKQAGIVEGTRSGLWSECARLVGEIRPRYAIFENVTNLLNGGGGDWFKRVLWDISKIGYDAEWHCISCSDIGGKHRRNRVWIIAYPASSKLTVSDNEGELERGGKASPKGAERSSCGGGIQVMANTKRGNQQMGGEYARVRRVWELDATVSRAFWEVESGVDRVADGVPSTMDRLKGLGNAVVPQIPEIIGRAIMEYENATQINQKD